MTATKRKIIYTLAVIGAVGTGVVTVVQAVSDGSFDASTITEATTAAVLALTGLLARAHVDV